MQIGVLFYCDRTSAVSEAGSAYDVLMLLCVRDLVRAPGWRGSRDGIRTVKAGYRAAVARQTVTSCRAERPIWDDTG